MSETISAQPRPAVRRIFICTNGNCTSAQNAQEIFALLRSQIQAHNLDDFDAPYRVKVTTTGCLDVCREGPILMIQPESVRYCRVNPQAAQEIFLQHILAGQVVQQYTCPPDSKP